MLEFGHRNRGLTPLQLSLVPVHNQGRRCIIVKCAHLASERKYSSYCMKERWYSLSLCLIPSSVRRQASRCCSRPSCRLQVRAVAVRAARAVTPSSASPSARLGPPPAPPASLPPPLQCGTVETPGPLVSCPIITGPGYMAPPGWAQHCTHCTQPGLPYLVKQFVSNIAMFEGCSYAVLNFYTFELDQILSQSYYEHTRFVWSKSSHPQPTFGPTCSCRS